MYAIPYDVRTLFLESHTAALSSGPSTLVGAEVCGLSAAKESHISDDTALQLLKLTNEGVDLQIFVRTTEEGGNFLENFRKRYGKPDSQARFWNGMSRPSVSACDAVVRDLEHYSFKVQMVWVNLCKHRALCGGACSSMS